ncbi:MAG: M48 family metalloprotease [Phascolarctobacterium sp.]|nr:M48 family metalloprotease [Phascolarctobacterium sp.]
MLKSFLKIVLASLIVISCSYASPTEAGMISKEQEISMGKATAQQLEAQYGLSQDYILQERVDRIGQRLAAVCPRKDLEYSFKVLNNSEINALACPGGFIYVYKGLLDFMPSDTELAGVLSHEITHVTQKHTVHAIEKQMLGNILLIGAAVAAGGDAIGLIQTVQAALYSGFSRTDERGADKGGLSLCIEAGYNPYSVLITMFKLDDYSKSKGYKDNYGVFSSHPEPEERAKRLHSQLAKLNIHPDIVTKDDDHATVCEGDWYFNINNSIGATKAKYRAYMLAGSLWTVRQKGYIDPNHFVVYDYGTTADIYYDDIQLYTVYPQDTQQNTTPGSCAANCVESLKTWANIANTQIDKKSKK